MKLFIKQIEIKLPKWSIVAILFALSILVYDNYWANTSDSIQVFRTELLKENTKDGFALSYFSFDEISISQPLLKSTFYQSPRIALLPIKINETVFQSVNKTALDFDRPTFFYQNRIPSTQSDLPDFYPLFS